MHTQQASAQPGHIPGSAQTRSVSQEPMGDSSPDRTDGFVINDDSGGVRKTQLESDATTVAGGSSACEASAKDHSAFSRFVRYFYTARLEVFLLLYILGRSMTSTSIQDLLLQKACLNSLQCNSSVCDQLNHYKDINDHAEKIASNYSMLRMIVSLAPSAAISIFIGPWCDKYGYKAPLLMSNLGYILSTVLVLLTVYQMSLPLYVDVLAAIPDGISGGIIAVFMTVYSEATIGSRTAKRRIKFFLLDLTMSAAFPLGNVVGGQVYGNFGMSTVLLASISVSVIAELWALFAFRAPDSGTETKDSLWTKLRGLLQLQNFVEGFRACVRPRPAKGKVQLWCLLVALSLLVMDFATLTVSYYFVRKMYSWSVAYYSTVSAVSSAVSILLNLPIIWLFTRVLKVSDPWMAVIGVSFGVARLVICGLAYTEWLFYLQCVVGVPSFVGHVGIRTHLSKIVEHHEVGKVFSFLSSFESLLPIIGDVLFTQIFNLSIGFLPGLVYLTAAALSVFPLILLAYCARVSSHSYRPIEKEGEMARDRQHSTDCDT